jgi:hypothetical protein
MSGSWPLRDGRGHFFEEAFFFDSSLARASRLRSSHNLVSTGMGSPELSPSSRRASSFSLALRFLILADQFADIFAGSAVTVLGLLFGESLQLRQGM